MKYQNNLSTGSYGAESGCIYGIVCPETGDIVYIGKTTLRLSVRFSSHISSAKSGRRNTTISKWIAEKIKDGKPPAVKELAVIDINEIEYWEALL